MAKILQLKTRDKTGKLVNRGCLKIKNSISNKSAELHFDGDIVSDSWDSYWYDEDKCPQDVLDFLSQLDGTERLDIYMNSGGGSVFAGLAIYNYLMSYKGEKIGHIMALSASISSVIILACDKVIMHTGSTYMIHKPLCSCQGNADYLRKIADTLDVCEDAIVQVYMRHVKEGVTEDTIRDLMKSESWMTFDTATQYFDFEQDESEEAVACAGSYFFNSYKHTPKNIIQEDKESGKVIDYNRLADMVADKLADKFEVKNNENVPQSNDSEKEDILKDLESYGI